MEDEDIAAAMGFSSFGGTKKRKYDQTNSPKAKVDASGANTTRLGVRSKASSDANQPHSEADDGASTAQHMLAKPTAQRKQEKSATTGLAAFLSRGKELPEQPYTAAGEKSTAIHLSRDDSSVPYMVSFGGPAITQAELAALRIGVLDENGDKAYFLPGFVEDPWEEPTWKTK